jgi:hypothetical protein
MKPEPLDIVDDQIEPKIAAVHEENPIREVLELLLERIKALEERVSAPPIKQGKR